MSIRTTASLKIDFYPSTSILDAFKEACRLSTFLNVDVQFSFNGVTCISMPNSEYNDGVKAYHECIGNIKIAFARTIS